MEPHQQLKAAEELAHRAEMLGAANTIVHAFRAVLRSSMSGALSVWKRRTLAIKAHEEKQALELRSKRDRGKADRYTQRLEDSLRLGTTWAQCTREWGI